MTAYTNGASIFCLAIRNCTIAGTTAKIESFPFSRLGHLGPILLSSANTKAQTCENDSTVNSNDKTNAQANKRDTNMRKVNFGKKGKCMREKELIRMKGIEYML
ncbi:hypothetical protein RFI_13946 [Reticulomyxa filosa]|uniref:Uncharacterized protein n=1 Tax=Reticulomyxa filosa TaxID=46433 RepID=X6NB37_RETFI|nr:hypothetical protein RFI_13946 [Reticulomyxa filosa]|eukprot:ETO23236.1 hypothetical protein RFI_13946 [Reticulomyxa filosa]